jgi:YVTN family beta-propeller protein
MASWNSGEAGSPPGFVTPISTATNQAGTPITAGYSSRAIAITPDGRFAYVVNYLDNTVTMIDTASNKVAATIKVGSYPWAIAIAP